jgi:hypothetical protein
MGSLQEHITGTILTWIRKRRTASSSPESNAGVQSTGAIAPAKLREVRFSDFDAVAELKQRWGMTADSLENWKRLWKGNPALMHGEIGRPMGWVLEADGVIVGYLGNISLRCRYGNRTLTAVTAHGFVVEGPYRALALSLAAAFFSQKSVDLYISTTSIGPVGKMALAFKSAYLPQSDYDSVLFWVLQPYPFAQALMTKLNLGPTAARIGSALSALAIGSDKALRRRWARPSAAPFTISEIALEDIGDDFQALWTAKLNERPRLFADRSPAVLRWHFEIPGDRGSARVLCCHKDGELVGYAVIRTDTDPHEGLRKSIIADTLVRQDDPEIVRALWAAAYKIAKLEGSHVLEVLGFPPSIRQACSEWKPNLRKYPGCPYYYKAADPVLHKRLSDGAAWYATPFDGDATLIRPSYSSSILHGGLGVQTEDSRESIASQVPVGERTEVF